MSASIAAEPGFFSRERTIATPTFNRWLVPPAALAIHLCIGMAYGFSVFWLPLSRAVGITQSIACPADMGFLASLVATGCDWKISQLGWMYTLFFVLLGCSAAIWGGWLERAGPRKAGLVSAFCWCGGLLISALGVHLHQLWMLWLGSGVIGGIGLGLGYISPVSTLIKWFPDRRGMATGMAIMGFGGGAMIGAPLADWLMRQFATATSVGVWQTFVAMAVIYAVFMVAGALGYRVPREDWKPGGWTPPATSKSAMVSSRNVDLEVASRTPQFWLIWAALCLNVSAGIGVIGMASPMLQEVFGGKLIGLDIPFGSLDAAQKAQIAAIAAGFTGLLSLCNIGGRFLWATSSDKLGRKLTFAIFFTLGFALYAAVPTLAGFSTTVFFVLAIGVIISMYGGGFATVPAYLADMFGTKMVGAIHGRLLTAWATAGILGPVLVNYLREYQLASGLPNAQAYNQTMYILAGLLVLGMVCNLLVRPVASRHHMAEVKGAQVAVRPESHASLADTPTAEPTTAPVLVAVAWAAVGLPLLAGVLITLQKAAILLH
ncbi:OFA family MFS transporter [Methylobacterium durans]|uniref:MFS transporter n=1 Tax=Methylobacterium durans TaxID=2202825 RepID=A0A2U8W0X8_9HYPH|nr:OFA family MFS transporter [Methylobacterium durans]AWN39739.1 MFS transporter [Methylobacterium durans]